MWVSKTVGICGRRGILAPGNETILCGMQHLETIEGLGQEQVEKHSEEVARPADRI